MKTEGAQGIGYASFRVRARLSLPLAVPFHLYLSCSFPALVPKDSASKPKTLLWEKRKERVGKEQSPDEPCAPQAAAVLTTAELQVDPKLQWNCQVLQSYFFYFPVKSGPGKVPLTCFRALSGPTKDKVCLVPIFPLCLVWVLGKLNHEPPWLTASAFLYTTWLSLKPVAILPLSGKTTPGTVFGKCFHLLSGEYSLLGKKLSFINIAVVIVIFPSIVISSYSLS